MQNLSQSIDVAILLVQVKYGNLTFFIFPFSFFLFLLLFNYSCMPFLPIPPLHPSWTHLRPPPPSSPLVLSMCPYFPIFNFIDFCSLQFPLFMSLYPAQFINIIVLNVSFTYIRTISDSYNFLHQPSNIILKTHEGKEHLLDLFMIFLIVFILPRLLILFYFFRELPLSVLLK